MKTISGRARASSARRARRRRRRPAAGRSRAPPRCRSCPGMRMSRKTMSGWCVSVSCTASAPFFASADDLELGPHLGEAGAHLLAHQPLVVGDHGARSWRLGRCSCGLVAGRSRLSAPQPGEQPTAKQREQRQPRPATGGRPSASSTGTRAPATDHECREHDRDQRDGSATDDRDDRRQRVRSRLRSRSGRRATEVCRRSMTDGDAVEQQRRPRRPAISTAHDASATSTRRSQRRA